MSPTAVERLALYFGAMRSRQALLARAELGVADAGDPALAAQLAQELAAEVRPDGSVRGAPVPTIWRVHELLDLGRDARDPVLSRALGCVLQRQNAPGAYGEGCDKTRHTQRICEHFLRGFFSAAPAAERVAPITLPSGKVFRAEPAARFAVSCLALRAVLRAGLRDHPPVAVHLDSLRALAKQWTDWNGLFAPDVIVSGLHALALSGPALSPTVERLVHLVAGKQHDDGHWEGADLFQTLQALVATGLPAARAAVRRAVPALEERQRADGTFGATAQQERALIGLRALRWAGAG
ncbi:MAG TPA: hypothetical protein VJQ46_17735 [Gemmatimonadales bacterium]|nr:hypothetical protein [Gemmatimonadales bacterium]